MSSVPFHAGRDATVLPAGDSRHEDLLRLFEPGCGTTVRMYLPRSFAAETEMPLPDSGPAVGGRETILVDALQALLDA